MRNFSRAEKAQREKVFDVQLEAPNGGEMHLHLLRAISHPDSGDGSQNVHLILCKERNKLPDLSSTKKKKKKKKGGMARRSDQGFERR